MEESYAVLPSRPQYKEKPVGLYSKGEEIFNAVSHIVGGAIGIAIFIIGIIFAYPSVADIAAMAVFGVSVIVLYTMSALYHFLRGDPRNNGQRNRHEKQSDKRFLDGVLLYHGLAYSYRLRAIIG